MRRIYDASTECAGCSACPVADFDETNGTVTLHDPAAPGKGKLVLSKSEYNALLKDAPKLP